MKSLHVLTLAFHTFFTAKNPNNISVSTYITITSHVPSQTTKLFDLFFSIKTKVFFSKLCMGSQNSNRVPGFVNLKPRKWEIAMEIVLEKGIYHRRQLLFFFLVLDSCSC